MRVAHFGARPFFFALRRASVVGMPRRVAFPLLLVLALAACGGGEERKGGLSADEEQRLANVAKMLDENMVFDASPEALNEGVPMPPPPGNRQ